MTPLNSLITFFLCSTACIAASRPNVIVILADDMGYGDVQALNPASKIPTPALDSLARDGATFLDAHTPSSVCTPTRYGLLTGRYCWRSRLKRGVLNGYGEPLMLPDRLNLGGFLKQHGYSTGIIGKWHLGLGFRKDGGKFDFTKPLTDGPHTRGFDESFIIPASLDFPPYVYIRNGTITKFPSLPQESIGFPRYLRNGERAPDLNPEDCLDDLLHEARAFVRRRAGDVQPFFLYFPLTAPHKPVWPHPRFVGKSGLGPYGDFVMQVDTLVGGLLETIDAAGIRENTLVIYTSDNGSFMRRTDDPEGADHLMDATQQQYYSGNHTANGPWRGTKADIWEAGHRVPFFVRWPARVQAGIRIQPTVCLTDIFMTIADVIGAERPMNVATDSYSFLPLLTGALRQPARPPVIHHSAAGMFAIRQGDWKLVLGDGSGGRQQPKGKPFQKPYHLSNLRRNPGESRNFVDAEPSIARELETVFEEIHQNERQ
jgi:arylsulfatase A